MKAIVLSCDKYHPIAYHMVLSYEKIWPTNKLIYRIPWNNTYPKDIIESFKNKIEAVKVPLEFKKTIEGLLKGLDDDEWIFWCSDDTYLIEINFFFYFRKIFSSSYGEIIDNNYFMIKSY